MSAAASTNVPAVDVILPTHARPHTIRYSIAAVLGQTRPNLTLHVVGDGCDERTAEVVRAVDDPRVVFHPFPKAPGYGYANRNTVLRSLTGEYVAYASDDDLWFPDHLAHALDALDNERLEYLITPSIHVRRSGELDPNFFAFDWTFPVVSGFLRNWFLGATTMVHRRRLLDTLGYWNEDLMRFGDRDMWERCRNSTLAGAYRRHPTILRFYAQDWDDLYDNAGEPPQARFLQLLADPEWCASVRRAGMPGRRSLATRGRQWTDLVRFARRSGPKFVRFMFHRWKSHAASGGTLAQRTI